MITGIWRRNARTQSSRGCTASASVIIQCPNYVGLTQGLVGAWSFDGATMGTTSAYDVSGNGNTGWLANGPKKVAGKIGQVLFAIKSYTRRV